jgi:hypothetical protein
LLNIYGIRDELPSIRNINAGKNRQPTQDEVTFLREHLPTLEMGLRDTQERMKDTRNRLQMAWVRLNALKTDVPPRIFQAWLDQATSPPVASTTSSDRPKLFRSLPAMNRRAKSHHRADSISYPDLGLHAQYVRFLGFISTAHVHQLTLRRYESNYALLKEEINLVKTLLHPLHGVPSEALEEIFLCVVEGSEIERRKRSVERGVHPNAKAWPAPFALAAVCRDWRMLVCGKPRLWKYLVLDVRDKKEYHSNPSPMIHERIRQHVKYSHDLPLSITIIAWGDYLRERIVPMILPLLREGNLVRQLDSGDKGLERVELVTGGRNDREAGYTEILEGLPPAQHLALVRVWPANTDIRVPSGFCVQLRRIEAYDAVFHLEGPCPSVTEGTLFRMDRGRVHGLLNQTPYLERLTVDKLGYTDSDSYSPSPIGTMARLHTMALCITDLNACLMRFKLAPAIVLPALRKLVLIDMPDIILSDDWRGFVDINGQYVEEVEVRAIVAHARKQGKSPGYLAHLCRLPALTSLHLVGDCIQQILGAMALQPRVIGSMQMAPVLSGVTRIRVSDCKLPKRALQMYGWSSLHPSVPWVWSRGNAKSIQMTLDRIYVEDTHVNERSFTN